MKNLKKMIVATLLLSAILIGCNSLTQDNYNKIKIGMNYQEIVTIIGKPDKCDAALGTKNCIWGNKDKNITIKFIADRVVLPTMKGL